MIFQVLTLKSHTVALCFYRREASLCPDVVVAQIDPKKLKKKQSVNVSVSATSDFYILKLVMCVIVLHINFVFQITGCLAAPQGFSPSLKWQQQQVSRFSEVRQVFSLHVLVTCSSTFNIKYLRFVCLFLNEVQSV